MLQKVFGIISGWINIFGLPLAGVFRSEDHWRMMLLSHMYLTDMTVPGIITVFHAKRYDQNMPTFF